MTTLLIGALTTHFLGADLNYANKVGPMGTILNPTVALLVGNEFKLGVIVGTDSVGGTISGPISEYQFNDKWSMVLGAYNCNEEKYEARGIEQMNNFSNITLIAGAAHNYQLTHNIKLTTVVSLGIVVNMIRVDF